jgi:hypothetical protein
MVNDFSTACDKWGTPEYEKAKKERDDKFRAEHPNWYNQDGTAKPSKAEQTFDVAAYQKKVAKYR